MKALRDLVESFVADRDWHRFHNPKNLVMSLAIETAELMEHFQWLTSDQASTVQLDDERLRLIEEEVADCLAYLLAIANTLEIDLSTALRDKMKRNEEKYPIGEHFEP